ncbi:MAG TPA: OmpA family protein [Dysgonamonadaceae bacterium]|nr:OmpA family protein [Dysgonamonadaceae bacterium]
MNLKKNKYRTLFYLFRSTRNFGKLTFLALLMIGSSFSLPAASLFKKAPASNDLLNRADTAYRYAQYYLAAKNYRQFLLNTDTANAVVSLKLFDCYWKMREYGEAEKILEILPIQNLMQTVPELRIRLAELQARKGNYLQAGGLLESVAGYEKKAAFYLNEAARNYIMEDSVDWLIAPLNINTSFREYSPVLYDEKMFYTSNLPFQDKEKSYLWDGRSFSRLWQIPLQEATVEDSAAYLLTEMNTTANVTATKYYAPVFEGSDTRPLWSESSQKFQTDYTTRTFTPKGKPAVVTGKWKYNVGTASFDTLGNIYFSANRNRFKGTKNTVNILQAKFADGQLLYPKPVFPEDTFSYLHPAVSADGKLLIFSSNRKDGKGAFDLYYVTRQNLFSGWSEIKSFTDSVNTPGNEVFPSLGTDGYLYFSSDGKAGFGGLDIYRIPLQKALNGEGSAELIGYPVNGPYDDFGWIQETEDTTKGFFTSDRRKDNDDIFAFRYQPQPKISYITGIVLEKKTRTPMPGATVFLLNEKTGEVLVDKADSTGRYTFVINNMGDYTVKAVEINCKDDCLSMELSSAKPKYVTFQAPRPLLLELTFKPVWVINNVLYDFDKWHIRDDARPILDSVVTILKTYPIKVELGSHTDCRGSFRYNDRLSQRRAESAVAYIVSRGIDPSRITAKGYGERKLVNRCSDGVDCTEEEHQQNRRTEITVIYNPSPANSIDPTPYHKGDKLRKENFPENFFTGCR